MLGVGLADAGGIIRPQDFRQPVGPIPDPATTTASANSAMDG